MKQIFLSLLFAGMVMSAEAQKIERVEPLNWWIGMQHPLQLMFYGNNLADAKVSINTPDITVVQVHNAESAHYIFVDIAVAPNAKAGEYVFTIEKNGKKIKQAYRFEERRAGSAERTSFSSKDMIYLLMPDRFAQGDPKKKNPLKGKVDRTDDYARHGGDIQGIIDHLDYIEDLGATAIWSTPLTEDNELQSSYHGYACSDYYKIDPRFGTNDLYKNMVEVAHQKKLKIIMDVVPNHCGSGHWWMPDLPFSSWINHYADSTRTNGAQTVHIDPYASKAETELCVTGWFDKMMPDINLANPFALNYFAQMVIWWVEWADLDGLRVDTYPYNDKTAIAEWTKRILAEYPNFNIVGECWINFPAMVAYWEGASANKDGYSSHLPTVMDFPLQDALSKAMSQSEVYGWYQGMMNVYFTLVQDFVYANPNSLLIFGDNHDTDRLAHYTKGNARKQMLALAMLATMRGVPQIYYGTEQIFRGNQQNGHGGQRIDFPGGWASDTINLFTGKGRNKEQTDVYQYARRIFNWRKNATVVHEGKTMHFFPANPENVYTYVRYTDDELVLVVINPNFEERAIEWSKYAEVLEGYDGGLEVVSGEPLKFGALASIQPRQALVLHCKK